MATGAEVKVTFTPTHFDLLREAIKGQMESALQAASDPTSEASDRHKARERMVRLRDLLERLA